MFPSPSTNTNPLSRICIAPNQLIEITIEMERTPVLSLQPVELAYLLMVELNSMEIFLKSFC